MRALLLCSRRDGKVGEDGGRVGWSGAGEAGDVCVLNHL